MYILMISRGIPSKDYPQWGCFEKDQAEALAAYGHKVVVMSVDARFTKRRGSLGIHHIVINGVEYYNYVVLPGVFLTKILGLDNYIKNVKTRLFSKVYRRIFKTHGKPDVIYSQFFWNTVMGVKLKEKTSIPVVGIEHLARFNEPNLPIHDYKWASYAFKNADRTIAVAQTLSKNLEKLFGRKFDVVHNMYGSEFQNTNVFSEQKKCRPLQFVSTATLEKRKGFDVLIEAFAIIDIPRDKWQLKIIGRGSEKENLQNLIVEKRLQDNIHLLGMMDKDQIVSELKQSDVFVLPSRNENFSVAILEGLAMGLPVLATDCGGIRECLDDSNGIIVPVDNASAMAIGIKEMISNYSNYNRISIAENCKIQFSPAAIAERLTEIFNDVIKLE